MERARGQTDRYQDGSQNRRRGFQAAFVALLAAGCARGPVAVRQDMGDAPTIGRNNWTAPRGRTIPPAGLGVDLVQDNAKAQRDALAAPASFARSLPAGQGN
jgi:hypothetical protein